jgi:tetratricopeptide (TPR) repeat protein
MNMKRILMVLTAFLALLICATSAFAQRPESLQENMLLSAVKKYNEGNHDAARATLNAILEKDQTSDAAWYYLAMCSLAEKDVEMAESRLEKAVSLDPDNYWYRYRLAGIYGATSRYDLTIETYEKLLADFPKKSELYYNLVELYASQGQVDKALETLNEIETVFGMTETLAVFRFNLLKQSERQDEAFRTLKEYNSKYSSPFVLSTLAEYELSMYNDSTALAYFNEALDVAPDYAPAILGKAETYRISRKYDEYFKVLKDYVINQEEYPKAKIDYLTAVLQRSDARFIKAHMPKLDEIFDDLIQTHPGDSDILHLTGVFYHSTGRKVEAGEYFKNDYLSNPDSITAALGYLEYLMLVEDWTTLSAEARKAFRHFPQEATLLELASMGEYNLKDYDKVLAICDQIIEVAPADSARTLRAWSTKGDVYHQAGEPKMAYKAYEKALKINPDYVYVLNNYAYYLSMEGRSLKKALAMSRKTIEAEPDNGTYLDTYGWILYLLGKPEEAKSHFKHAMLYGGKESVVVLDHYAEVLLALGEYDRAMVYWNQALRKNNGDVPDLQERVDKRKNQIKAKTARK